MGEWLTPPPSGSLAESPALFPWRAAARPRGSKRWRARSRRSTELHDFDPATFVCIGDGRPIGFPRIEFKVDPREWQIFESVDRSRGDALLAMAWLPSGPPGW